MKNSATKDQSRTDAAREPRKERVPMGVGVNLSVSPSIMAEIEAKQCKPRMCLDDQQGKIQRYLDAGYEYYTDANGKHLTRPGGNGKTHILMMQPLEYWNADQALKKKKNHATIAEKAKLDDGEYIPDDREYVVSPDL